MRNVVLARMAAQLALESGLDVSDVRILTAFTMGIDIGLSLAFRAPEWALSVSREAEQSYIAYSGHSIDLKLNQMDRLIERFPVEGVE